MRQKVGVPSQNLHRQCEGTLLEALAEAMKQKVGAASLPSLHVGATTCCLARMHRSVEEPGQCLLLPLPGILETLTPPPPSWFNRTVPVPRSPLWS